MGGSRWAVTTAAAVLVLAACTAGSRPDPPAPEPLELSVLTFNVEYGGDRSTDAVIEDVGADVVGVLESYDRLPRIARRAGYPYYDVGLQLLSKHPIHEPSGADGLYALVEVEPGRVVAVVNTHLDYVRYGPRLLRNGVPVSDVLASEDEVRTSAIELLTPSVEELLAEGYPVFLTGDLNQPSSLDWTGDAIGLREGVTEAVPWPVSEALLGTGLRDSFREVHPDPVEDPGLTFGDGDRGERIDYLYAGGPVVTRTSELVGQAGGPDVDRGYERWTSDHRAVLSTFDVTPVGLPQTVSLERRLLTEGEQLGVLHHSPGHPRATITVVPEGESVAEALVSLDVEGESGTTSVDTTPLDAGGYDVVLADAGGDELERNSFWVRSAEPGVSLTTDRTTYAVGEPIEVAWDAGPANRWDWIGVYRRGAADPERDDYLLWGYTGDHAAGVLPPTVLGDMTLGPDSPGRPWPLPPGDYRIHYLLSDQYRSAGSIDVTVQ